MTSFERQPANFECELVDPNAPIQWFVNGKEVENSDIFEIKKDRGIHRLIIKECAAEHEGEVKVRRTACSHSNFSSPLET